METQKWTCPSCNRNFKREIYLKRHLARPSCVAEKDAILETSSSVSSVTASQPVSPRSPSEETPFMEIISQLDNAWFQFREQLIQVLQKQDVSQKANIVNLLPRTIATLDAQTNRSIPKLSTSKNTEKNTRTTMDLSRSSRKSKTPESDDSSRGGESDHQESECPEL